MTESGEAYVTITLLAGPLDGMNMNVPSCYCSPGANMELIVRQYVAIGRIRIAKYRKPLGLTEFAYVGTVD